MIDQIISYLNQNNINYQTDLKLDKCTYDLLIGHLLVKFNPLYPNSEPDSDILTDCQTRIETAEKNNYLYLEWYDWYDYQELINRLSPKQHIYMRTCYIKGMSEQEVRSFHYITDHIYNSSNIYLGIYHKKTQQLLASFVFQQTSSNNFTIIEIGYRPGVLIPGVLSKLMSYFIKTYNPDTITTNIFSSKMYKACNMKIADRHLSVKQCYYNRKDQCWTDQYIEFAPTKKYVCLDTPDTAIWTKMSAAVQLQV